MDPKDRNTENIIKKLAEEMADKLNYYLENDSSDSSSSSYKQKDFIYGDDDGHHTDSLENLLNQPPEDEMFKRAKKKVHKQRNQRKMAKSKKDEGVQDLLASFNKKKDVEKSGVSNVSLNVKPTDIHFDVAEEAIKRKSKGSLDVENVKEKLDTLQSQDNHPSLLVTKLASKEEINDGNGPSTDRMFMSPKLRGSYFRKSSPQRSTKKTDVIEEDSYTPMKTTSFSLLS